MCICIYLLLQKSVSVSVEMCAGLVLNAAQAVFIFGCMVVGSISQINNKKTTSDLI